MKIGDSKFFVFSILLVLFLSGCATAPRRVESTPTADLSNQVTQLQGQLQAKDQQIQDLQSQLESHDRSIETKKNFSKTSRPSKSMMIRVDGVTPTTLQEALKRAGLDPGPIDGHIGKKTKKAVREFQKQKKLNPDGIVGTETWSLLK